ncbi:hypothetical protein GCM10009849_18050 [Sinomonas flava]|uniref:Dihydrodipicolinate synthetase family protein n=1 Tax=Sinomonas flava TaxID=496857 RepID=A0ABN3BT46_9MICC
MRSGPKEPGAHRPERLILTPLDEHRIDEAGLTRLVERGAAGGADSLGVLGATGSYAYLTREERRRVLKLAVAHRWRHARAGRYRRSPDPRRHRPRCQRPAG